jgi:general secretion pathway protein F
MRKTNMTLISIQQRADLFHYLAQLERSGLTAQQSFSLLEKQSPQLQQLQEHLKLGEPISEAGFKSGVFSTFDKTMVHAGESSGKLAIIYQQLAEYYAHKVKNFRHIKSKLYLPIAIAILAIFIQAVPSLILGHISVYQYLLSTIGLIVKLALLFYLIYKIPHWFSAKFLTFRRLFDSIKMQLPLTSNWLMTRQVNEFLYSLGLMLSAGLAMSDAMPKAIEALTNSYIRSKFSRVPSAIRQGNSLALSLENVTVINDEIVAQITIGENSGSLAETLLHYTKIKTEKIQLQQEMIAEWIPKIIYLFILLSMAASILGSNPFSIPVI